MHTYISMLRGINVGGSKKILMKDLILLYESLGFKKVRTYVQSGNVIFDDSEKNTGKLEVKIEKKIKIAYGDDVKVIIRTTEDLQKVLMGNPFLKRKGIDMIRLYLTFLSSLPAKSSIDGMKNISYLPDEFSIIGREVFIYAPGGYGETKISNNFFEKKLGVAATTRNWNSVNKLFEMASNKSV